MHKINTSFVILLVFAIGALTSCGTATSTDATPAAVTETTSTPEDKALPGVGQIAYVNLDSLNANFAFLSDKLELMRSEQAREEKNFKRKAKAANDRLLSLQEQAYTMTPTQLEEASAEMEQKERQLQADQEKIAERLLGLERQIQTELDERINRHLELVNSKYGYDYILAKAAGSGVLLVNPIFEITDEVLNSLNEEYAAEIAAEKEKK